MRKNRPFIFWLMIVMSVAMFTVAVYLPVVVAWNNRVQNGDGVFVTCSWLMSSAAFLYVPLTKFHASMNGYIFYLKNGEALIFVRNGDFFG